MNPAILKKKNIKLHKRNNYLETMKENKNVIKQRKKRIK